jgi:hypothetical protein
VSKLADAVRRALSALTPAPAATKVVARDLASQPRTESKTSTMTTTTTTPVETTATSAQAPTPAAPITPLSEAEQIAFAAITRSGQPAAGKSLSPAVVVHADLSAKSAPPPASGSRVASPTQRQPSTPAKPWTRADGGASIPRSVSPVDRYTVAIAEAGWKVDVQNPAGVTLVGKGRSVLNPQAVLYGFRDYLISLGHYPDAQTFDDMAANLVRDVLMALPKTASLLPEAA